jgi:hypothetical protein
MRFRKLRIAWSVTCGIACVLLLVLHLTIFSGCSSETKPKVQPPQPVQEKTTTPKAPFEWTRSEKKQFLERLKTIKEGDKIEDVVKVLGPPYHTKQTAGKKEDDIRATVISYYLKKKDELTFNRSDGGFQTETKMYRTASEKTDSNEHYDQRVSLIFGSGNRLDGVSTNIKGVTLQSVKFFNTEAAVLENLDEPMD